ncbi:MAG: hypothetical protein OXC69_09030, partial [Candidatus Tectomicrobia bacterium]|nr:hypothetical protein [Candidatus Tectomicrobia bacterium]
MIQWQEDNKRVRPASRIAMLLAKLINRFIVLNLRARNQRDLTVAYGVPLDPPAKTPRQTGVAAVRHCVGAAGPAGQPASLTNFRREGVEAPARTAAPTAG